MKPFWTVDDVLAEHPCLSVKTIRVHFGEKTQLTIQEILDLPDLSAEYKVWMACRRDALPPGVLDAWKTAVLTRVITAHALPHPSTRVWAERWLSGEDRTTSGAAEAAWAAVWAAAVGAAWAADYRTQILELRSLLKESGAV